jgi:PBP1b-binding outer membrane lipoprotein LpoB
MNRTAYARNSISLKITAITLLALLLTACSQQHSDTAAPGSFSAAAPVTINQEVELKDSNTTVNAKTAPRASSSAEPDKSIPSTPLPAQSETAVATQSPSPIVTKSSTPSNTAIKQPNASTPTKSASKDSSNELSWSEFFDNEKQDTPSDKFWDLQGKEVTIKGYMGEVLSFDKNWFLLIPAPGAECPFDNGDETYWNKIMMVFVPSDTKLRYTANPIELKGTLDVGIKIDESGYKTMFRLYNTTFTEITE